MVRSKASAFKEEISISLPAKSSLHILLVEDEELLQQAIVETMTELGYKVSVYQNGKEALEFYKKSWGNIDLVILDMVMPVMGGKNTFLAMRNINNNLIVLIISGYSLTEKVQSIIDEGAKGFIQKPFKMNDLLKKIKGALNTK